MLADFALPVTLLLVFGISSVLMVRRLFDGAFLYIGINAFVLLIPSIFYAFGHTTDFENFFVLSKDNYLILQALIIAVFFLATVICYKSCGRLPAFQRIFPHIETVKSNRLFFIGIFVLFLLSSGIIFGVFMTSGNIASTVYQIRHGDALENFKFAQNIIRFSQLLSAAFLIDLLIRKKRRQHISEALIWLTGFLFFFSILTGALMGGKSYVAYPLFIFFITYYMCLKKQPLKAFILPLVIVIFLLPTLQMARVGLVLDGNLGNQGVITDSLGMDLLDSNLLYLESADRMDHTSVGEDFYKGLVGVIPRAIWKGKPGQITVGGRFKDTIVEGRQGGWPVFGFNQWYVNFGWLGVIMGGVLTGLIIRALNERYRDFTYNPFSACIMIFLTILLISPGGMDNLFLIEYILFVIPLFLFKFFANPYLYLSRHNMKARTA